MQSILREISVLAIKHGDVPKFKSLGILGKCQLGIQDKKGNYIYSILQLFNAL